jgi:hypothetical protein
LAPGFPSLVAVPATRELILNDGPQQIVVMGARVAAVNGTYHQTGDLVNGAGCYWKSGFCVIRDSDGWSISDFSERSGAGTPYYKAAVHVRRPAAPPRGGWLNTGGGVEGVPTLEYPVRSSGQGTPDTSVDSLRTTGGGSNESHEIAITGAGIQAVNGMYCLTRYFQGAGCYTMSGWYFGARTRFYLFCCNDASVAGKNWWISAVPPGSPLGTPRDIDFYFAPVQGQPRVLPPRDGWIKAQQRDDDAIALEYVRLQDPVHDALTPENLPSHRVVVTGAGPHAVNGIYRRDCDLQEPERACHYVMEVPENGPPSRFSIFRRRDHWYLSSVPVGVRPGTPGDFDFYIAPAPGRNRTVPPREGWSAADGAAEGAPTLAFCA